MIFMLRFYLQTLLVACFVLCSFQTFSQFKLKSQVTNPKVKELMTQKQFKLVFNLDSFSVDFLDKALLYGLYDKNDYNIYTNTNSAHFKSTPSSVKENFQEKFELAFNESAKGKMEAKQSIMSSLYDYYIKITPIKFSIFFQTYYVPRWPTIKSFFMQGQYKIDIINKSNETILTTINFSNVTNTEPMAATNEPKKYSKDSNEEINRNMALAGKEAAKYIRKLIKKSKSL